jgi:DNA-binding SARP family transcriptional activator
MEAVWHGDPPRSWPKQVQICVARLRKVLGSGAIRTLPDGYRLDPAAITIDRDEFEQMVERGRELSRTGEPDRAASTLGRALALWRGHPFDGLDGWDPARIEAARLEEVRRVAEEELVEARLQMGEHRAVVPEAEMLVAREPLREQRWAALALAQYRCGRQGDALASLRRARLLLCDQLGIDPGARTRACATYPNHARCLRPALTRA